ncbi:uncharacterized protein WCC33_016645 [Rhinophrynus dorsalis]
MQDTADHTRDVTTAHKQVDITTHPTALHRTSLLLPHITVKDTVDHTRDATIHVDHLHVTKAPHPLDQTSLFEDIKDHNVPGTDESEILKEEDKVENDTVKEIAGPINFISMRRFTTPVDPQVKHISMLVLSICGPVILCVLVIFIMITHFHSLHKVWDDIYIRTLT